MGISEKQTAHCSAVSTANYRQKSDSCLTTVRLTVSTTFRMLLAATLMIPMLGCGGSDGDQQSGGVTTQGDSGSETVAGDSGTGTTPVNSTSASGFSGGKHGRDEVWVDEDGQKWFGNVPYDVFFDQPLTVASNQTPVGGGLTLPGNQMPGLAANDGTAPANPAATPDTSNDPAPSADGDAPSWKDLITAEILDEEVKSIRNFLNENLQSVGNYNSSMLMIPPKAATLGVLAGVAMEHPDAVSWKDDAIYVRDLAKQMNVDTLQRGAKDQRRLLELFLSVSDTLNRSRPASLPEPPESDSFADVSEMRLVMMRMGEAEKRMKTEAGTDGSFSSNKDMVQHEASVLAALTHTITLPGYGYADDPDFVGYGKEMVDASRAIVGYAESGNFADYEIALSKISTTCQSCHSEFKND